MNATIQEKTDTPSSIPMIRALAGIAMISGLLIVMAFQITLPTIKKNKAIALQKAIFEVVPHTTKVANFLLAGDSVTPVKEPSDKGIMLFAAYDNEGNLTGVAVEASGQGYADKIKVLYGYSPEQQAVVGMKVLESKETPGLGDKIEIDETFRKNFEKLDVTLNDSLDGLLNEVATVKQGTKTHPWQIDGITGATISTKAIGKLMNQSTQQMVPLINKNLTRLRGEK
ncbi:MAG: RnfABCDGE type electron transport complex subunit G [SAR324 cluster bacterium]|nr:RnfABCDGE type electron transport complex subunit G [SAR324 cluster bacterium]